MPHITQIDNSTSATTQLDTLDDKPLQVVWTIRSQYQKGALTSVSVSTGGLLLASASLDSNLLFIDVQTGKLIAVLDFKGRFHITTLHWYTNFLLFAGCSNGMLFVITITPENHSVTMKPALDSFDAPITALALDPAHNLLAVGCGGEVFIFSWPTHVYEVSTWRLIDHISSPAMGRHGFVTALGFWTGSLEGYWLFVGHAKAGFCIWHGPGKYRRIPCSPDGYASSVGNATISNDGNFIAIVTLDHSVVIYPLHRDGPVIHEQRVFHNRERAGYRPIVPIALVADRLVLRGSASGDIPIFDLHKGPLAPIRNNSPQVVRALATHDNMVIVGLSNTEGQASEIKCYRDQPSPMPTYDTYAARVHSNDDKPIFEVAIDDSEGSAFGGLTCVISKAGRGISICVIIFTQPFVRLSAILRRRETWILMGLLWAFTAILLFDPPVLPGSPGSRPLKTGYRNATQAQVTTQNWPSQCGNETRGEYPELSRLFACSEMYVAARFTHWWDWLAGGFTLSLRFMFRMFVHLAYAVPLLIARFVTTDLPTSLSAIICDTLQIYQDIPICPNAP
ncbi:hypothetical protein FRC08_000880 [Ceratobasidium sp. 394]|nr:hypothetical protein FRC08_000880 [Ceratobasidium sp. 394]